MTRLIERCGCLAVFLIVWPTLSGIAAHLPGKQIDRLSRPFAITVDVAGTIVFVAAGVVIGSHCPAMSSAAHSWARLRPFSFSPGCVLSPLPSLA